MLEAWAYRDLNGTPAWSMRGHTGLPRRLVIRLKHGANACIARELAEIAVPAPADLRLSPDTVVTWVPMPAARRRERCIDHGRVLAECAARQLGLCCRGLLIRRGNGRTQEGLSMARRQANLRSAFAPAEEIGFPVLLVDDVLTTGTTAERCIAALREGGAREITVLTMTKAL
jgi:predicted amidophosphoribosyltransferase